MDEIRIGNIHKGMIKRVSAHGHSKYPAYIGCSASEAFRDKAFFINWYKNQAGCNLDWELDKDLLVKGNKIYSPETCILLPNRINTALCSSRASRGNLPLGVSLDSNGKYFARCGYVENGKRYRKTLVSFDNVDEAFLSYKQFKECYLKSLAEEYKYLLDRIAYDALINYSVDIDD